MLVLAAMLVSGLAYFFFTGKTLVNTDQVPSAAVAAFAGSQACAGCHAEQQAHWQQSDHYRAMEHANAQTVLGNFNNTTFSYFGRKTFFFKQNDQFLVKTENQQGELETFTVLYTLGYKPLQQYLVKFADGRIQALPFAWDTRPKTQGGQRWFHLYPDDNIKADNPLFWTRPLQNWNHMCGDCHTTNFNKNFSDVSNQFDSYWSELANGCESCHGPGSAHIVLMKENPHRTNDLLIKSLRTQIEQIDQCGVCHARRDRLQGNAAYEKMLQTWQPELLHSVLYFPDGQIHDEVFEVGSFMQSKMYAAGVTCSNCHDPHTTQLKADGNALCTQCHSKESYDGKQHHFHPANTQGSRCVSCHMPERTYMVVNPRHDHRFSIPRPDLSDKLATPNACVNCHKDKSNVWAAKQIDRHVRANKGSHILPEHFGVALWQARHQQNAAADSLQHIISGNAYNTIVKATVLTELGAYLDEGHLALVQAQLEHTDPLIRMGAVQALSGVPWQQSLPLLVNHLQDESRAVRLAVAPLLAGMEQQALTADQQRQREDLFDEYRRWLAANSDRADALVALAGFYLAQGDVMSAQKYFDKALQRDETSLPAYLNYADFYRSLDNDVEAEKLLRKAMGIYPDSADAHYALGLLLVRQQQQAVAMRELKQAVNLAPDNSHYAYVYGVGLYSGGNIKEALSWLATARQRFPANGQIQSAWQVYCAEQGGQHRFTACTP